MRGVALGPDFPREEYDYQQRYMRAWLKMIGVTEVEEITVERTLHGPEPDRAERARAVEAAEALAARL